MEIIINISNKLALFTVIISALPIVFWVLFFTSSLICKKCSKKQNKFYSGIGWIGVLLLVPSIVPRFVLFGIALLNFMIFPNIFTFQFLALLLQIIIYIALFKSNIIKFFNKIFKTH